MKLWEPAGFIRAEQSDEVTQIVTLDKKDGKTMVIDKKKCYCPFCDLTHEVEIVEENETTIFKNVEVTFTSVGAHCCTCDGYYEEEEMISRNDERIKDAYRKKENLLNSGDILALQEEYKLSRNAICDILGFDIKDIAHRVQSRSCDTALRTIIQSQK